MLIDNVVKYFKHEYTYLQAYAAGCNIVILASDFQRVQIIPGILYGNLQVSCLDCSTDTGKVYSKIKIACDFLWKQLIFITEIFWFYKLC